MVYLDQVLEDGNKQDSVTVFSLLEAAIVQINNDLSFIKEIALQSYNDKCYQSSFILFAISILNIQYRNKIYIFGFVHTETQDGKTILDAHFSYTTRFLSHFMKTWRRN
mmetsp:Transcript_11911/g.11462  ORF Transcript_11911/g.11462 Transcript_11911/m.11462 type:complete len:109 (+) Transcript_11911:4601-4927(+)